MKAAYQLAIAVTFFLPLAWLLIRECPRGLRILGWQFAVWYLGYLHSRIMRIDPSHEEATRTMLERDYARSKLAAAWRMA